jgi:hypothetical protein
MQFLLTSNIFELSVEYTIITVVYSSRLITAFSSPPLESGNAALCQKDKNEIVENWGAPVSGRPRCKEPCRQSKLCLKPTHRREPDYPAIRATITEKNLGRQPEGSRPSSTRMLTRSF